MTKANFSAKTDEDLLKMIQEDDLEAYEVFFERHRNAIYRYGLKKGLSPSLSEEALQIIFEKVFEKRALYKPEFKASQWLYIIAKSEVKDLRNREKTQENRKKDLDWSQIPESSPMDLLRSSRDESEDFWLLASELLGPLKEDEKELLRLRFFEDKSFEEIASLLDSSNQSLRKKLSRLFARAKKGDAN